MKISFPFLKCIGVSYMCLHFGVCFMLVLHVGVHILVPTSCCCFTFLILVPQVGRSWTLPNGTRNFRVERPTDRNVNSKIKLFHQHFRLTWKSSFITSSSLWPEMPWEMPGYEMYTWRSAWISIGDEDQNEVVYTEICMMYMEMCTLQTEATGGSKSIFLIQILFFLSHSISRRFLVEI